MEYNIPLGYIEAIDDKRPILGSLIEYMMWIEDRLKIRDHVPGTLQGMSHYVFNTRGFRHEKLLAVAKQTRAIYYSKIKQDNPKFKIPNPSEEDYDEK